MASEIEAQHQIALDVAALQRRAGATGMFETMQALHKANRVAGLELAKKIERAMKRSSALSRKKR